MPSKKTLTEPGGCLRDQAASLIGKERIKALDGQPMAIAAGGFMSLIDQAAIECSGYPDPASSVARRALQLAGSKPILTPPKKAEGKVADEE